MVGGVRRRRERQAKTIDYSQNLSGFSELSRVDLRATAFRRGKGCVDITRGIVDRAYIAQAARSVSAARIASFSHPF